MYSTVQLSTIAASHHAHSDLNIHVYLLIAITAVVDVAAVVAPYRVEVYDRLGTVQRSIVHYSTV